MTDDQGHGDAIQFFRYVPLLRCRGATVTWRTFPPLLRLLAAAAPDVTVLDALPADTRFDFQCNSTSLPRWFETELNSIPQRVPYLHPPARPPRDLQRPPGQRLRVGLLWSGDARHARDSLRSVPAEQFLRLADEPNVSFHSLRHEVRSTDLPALQARPSIDRQVEQAADFADTAAIIAGLDLVITVDTGIAHLAGALGKPVWIVLHVAADWRWLIDRADSPWYPTARLFRVKPAEWLADKGGSSAKSSMLDTRPPEETLLPPAARGNIALERAGSGGTSAARGAEHDRVAAPDAGQGGLNLRPDPLPEGAFPEHQSAAAASAWDAGWGPVLGRVAAALRALAAG